MSSTSRILAIDYGSKRIGLALSDPMQMFAKPLKVIPNDSPESNLASLISLIDQNEVSLVVLGMPYSLEGSITARTEETLAFKALLSENLHVPVVEWNETLSTSEANAQLHAMGYDWKKSRTMVDALAATLILKSYLDSRK